MVDHITLKDTFKMQRMGYTHRAFFINPFGVPFHKNFSSGEEMEKFIRSAREIGTKLSGFVSI